MAPSNLNFSMVAAAIVVRQDRSRKLSMSEWKKHEGSPHPLGVCWIAEQQAYNFALYSKHAERVTLHLYNTDDAVQPCYSLVLDYLSNKSGPVWHCRVSSEQAGEAAFYAYQIDGPSPAKGFDWHTFDSEKVLLDPYTQNVYFPPQFDREAACQPGANTGRAPLGSLAHCHNKFEWDSDHPVRHESELVIYELHVRGFTAHPNSGVPDDHRGTFLGVIDKIPYLRELGITAVELMPVFQFDPQEGNYWGYMPLNLFSPHHAYAANRGACRQDQEFREMVKALHQADIEVILDVVFNHTCEGNRFGPTYSFKGIDNSTYYMVTGDPEQPYADFAGTGNTLHTANRAVRRMVLESLRFWVKEMHVDGFRFDLTSIFTRNSDGSINQSDPPIFGQISADDDLANVRLIAEPWDAGGEFQLGKRFAGTHWLQWNAAYRDAVQRFVRGDAGMVPEMMSRLYGSSDIFPDERPFAFHPWQSLNYVTSHDGFTLYDLTAYNVKRNWANGHNNADGHSDFSWNCGWEGDDGVPTEVMRLRKQQVKNFFCLLLLSNGTPMFRMGDEFLQTQGGNNNPYNQDNETTWLDWSKKEQNDDILRFFKLMIRFRRDHASISRSRFWRDDISWYGTEHTPDLKHHSHAFACCLHGSSQRDADLYLMINAAPTPARFGIHEGGTHQWRRVVDTSRDAPNDICEESQAELVTTHFYDASPRCVVVLVRNKQQ
jgi:glycogen operon protein